MRINESLLDFLSNLVLSFWNFIKIKIFKVKFGNSEPSTSNMKILFEDNFESFDTDVWRVGQPWGLFHPSATYQYYGDSSVYIEESHLVLDQKLKPAKLKNWESDKIYEIPFSVGLITSKKSFGYGFYEFVVKLPNGAGLWPAVWLTCDVTWPPEIDINESYSDENGDYRNNLQSNFHFNFDEDKQSTGARNHIVYSDEDKIKMSCWWTEDFIKIYYNGHLVRQITCEETLLWFRNNNMIIVINNGIRPEYANSITEQISKFHIYSVRYWSN